MLGALSLALLVCALSGGLAVAAGPSLVAPKWYVTPAVDGSCADPAYNRADPVTLTTPHTTDTATARIVHSGVDAYLCVDGLSERQTGLDARFDLGGRRPGRAGLLQLSAAKDGRPTLSRSDASGQFSPIAGADVAGASSTPAGGRTSLEFRVGLDLLGGYARTEGLALFVRSPLLESPTWPESAGDDPASWGQLSLAPVYAPGLRAGSAFTDGLRGHLTIPFPPELTPGAMTIEAWVRPVGGDCGTVVGGGQRSSFWLALCRAAQFGTRGRGSEVTGRTALGTGWHHVAGTIDAQGRRVLYADGAADAGVTPGFLEEPPNLDFARLTPLPYGGLLVGADRDDPDGALHGYIRELRIWDHARRGREIKADAFKRLTGREPGLVGLWPFAGSLGDIAGGHNAGLTGNASLARSGLTVRRFRAASKPRHYHFRPAPPRRGFNGHIPFTRHSVKIDGMCLPDEYRDANDITLGPGRAPVVKAMLGADGVHLCAPFLYGDEKPGNALTLFLERADARSRHTRRSALRVQLTLGGLTTAVGNGKRFRNRRVAGVTAHIGSGAGELHSEDIDLPNLAYWTPEVVIGTKALRPLRRGGSLRLAIGYTATSQSPPGEARLPALRAEWPRGLSSLRPSTWGAVKTAARVVRHVQRLPRLMRAAGRLYAAGPKVAPPKPPPTAGDYNKACPVQGSQKMGPAGLPYITQPPFKWASVDGSQPFAQAEGTTQWGGPSISSTDAWPIHLSHDVDGEITPVPANRNLVIDGGNTLTYETESLGLPRQFRPGSDDHVTLLGHWIFDCGHEEDRHTELHPLFAVESDHAEERPVLPDAGLRHVRVANVWFNSTPNPGVDPVDWPFGFAHPFPKPFRFKVPLPNGTNPSEQKKLFVKVQPSFGGSVGDVTLTGVDSYAHFKIQPATTGKTGYTLTLGFLTHKGTITNGIAKTFRIQPKILTVADNRDDAATRGGGDWHFTLFANGVWRKLLGDDQLGHEQVVNQQDGQTVDLSGVPPVDVTAPGYDDLVMKATGFDDDSPYADGICGLIGNIGCALTGDDDLASDTPLAQGDLSALAKANGPLSIQKGNVWNMTYTVTQMDPGNTGAVLSNLWKPLLADEPNETDTEATPLAVPSGGQGKRPVTYTHSAFITENPFSHKAVFHIGGDVDRYELSTGDFSNVTFQRLPKGISRSKLEKTWNDGYKPPASVEKKLGTWGARFTVRRTSGSPGNRLYKQRESVGWRTVPGDPGEPDDAGSGRLVDLTKVAQGPGSIGTSFDVPGSRERNAGWAWQHVVSDVDSYEVRVPGGTPAPAGHEPNSCDVAPRLEISAPGMQLTQAGGPTAKDDLSFESLPVGSAPPDFKVDVKSATGHRGVYRLRARWEDAVWVDLSTCLRRSAQGKFADVHTVAPFPQGPEVAVWNPNPTRTFKVAAPIYQLGGFNPIKLVGGKRLNLALSSPARQPISGLLFDQSGLMLGESTPFQRQRLRATRIPDGLKGVARLNTGGLTAGQTYFVVPVAGFPIASGVSVESQLGGSLAH